MNPSGVWQETWTKFGHRFINFEINALYGFVTYKVREGSGSKWSWYWEARVLMVAESRNEEGIVYPICGYAPTLEAGKRIVETILKETLTVEFPENK
jgi:hypothetical protein